MEGANYDTVGTFNTGKNRVHGVEFGLSGDLTDKLSVQAGAAFMKSKVLGSAVAANIGKPAVELRREVVLGAGQVPADRRLLFRRRRPLREQPLRRPARYRRRLHANGMCSQPVPSFTVCDLFAAYRFNKKLDMRVNVLNVGQQGLLHRGLPLRLLPVQGRRPRRAA